MKKFKLAIVAMVIAAGSFAAFAFTTDANMEEQPPQPTTYWVTGKTGNNYDVSTNPNDAQNCGGDVEPCEILTSELPDPNGRLTPEQMESSSTSILSHQDAF